MERKPLTSLSPNSQGADGSKVPSPTASQGPSPDGKKQRERSPLRIPSTSKMELGDYRIIPIPRVVRYGRISKRLMANVKEYVHEIPTDDDKPPTCTKPDRKDSVDYFEALDVSIADSIKKVESSPPKDFWEATGAIPKYMKRDSPKPKTPPKVLPPFKKQSPTLPEIKIQLFKDVHEPLEKSEQKSVLLETASSTSTAPESIKPEDVSPSKTSLEGTGTIPKQMSPRTDLLSGKQVSTTPEIQIELVKEGPAEKSEELPETASTSSVEKPEEESDEPHETTPSAVEQPDEKLEQPETSPTSPVGKPEDKSEEPPESASSSSKSAGKPEDKSEEPSSSSTESKSPRRKQRSDFKDHIEWVKYNCLDFQDYKRTVNNKQKGVENSLDIIIPQMESSKKDAQNLAKKINHVRSEVCDSEEALKIQNDKLKYLVGRTMATVSKIDKVLERFRFDIQAYTTLSTEGNDGIEFRLNRLLKALCGMDANPDLNSMIRDAFSGDESWNESD